MGGARLEPRSGCGRDGARQQRSRSEKGGKGKAPVRLTAAGLQSDSGSNRYFPDSRGADLEVRRQEAPRRRSASRRRRHRYEEEANVVCEKVWTDARDARGHRQIRDERHGRVDRGVRGADRVSDHRDRRHSAEVREAYRDGYHSTTNQNGRPRSPHVRHHVPPIRTVARSGQHALSEGQVDEKVSSPLDRRRRSGKHDDARAAVEDDGEDAGVFTKMLKQRREARQADDDVGHDGSKSGGVDDLGEVSDGLGFSQQDVPRLDEHADKDSDQAVENRRKKRRKLSTKAFGTTAKAKAVKPPRQRNVSETIPDGEREDLDNEGVLARHDDIGNEATTWRRNESSLEAYEPASFHRHNLDEIVEEISATWPPADRTGPDDEDDGRRQTTELDPRDDLEPEQTQPQRRKCRKRRREAAEAAARHTIYAEVDDSAAEPAELVADEIEHEADYDIMDALCDDGADQEEAESVHHEARDYDHGHDERQVAWEDRKRHREDVEGRPHREQRRIRFHRHRERTLSQHDAQSAREFQGYQEPRETSEQVIVERSRRGRDKFESGEGAGERVERVRSRLGRVRRSERMDEHPEDAIGYGYGASHGMRTRRRRVPKEVVETVEEAEIPEPPLNVDETELRIEALDVQADEVAANDAIDPEELEEEMGNEGGEEEYNEVAPVALDAEATVRVAELVKGVYERRNPSKLGEVEALLKKYRGAEWEMYKSVCEKYGETPEPVHYGEACGERGPSPALPAVESAAAPAQADSAGGVQRRGFAKKASAPPPPPVVAKPKPAEPPAGLSTEEMDREKDIPQTDLARAVRNGEVPVSGVSLVAPRPKEDPEADEAGAESKGRTDHPNWPFENEYFSDNTASTGSSSESSESDSEESAAKEVTTSFGGNLLSGYFPSVVKQHAAPEDSTSAVPTRPIEAAPTNAATGDTVAATTGDASDDDASAESEVSSASREEEVDCMPNNALMDRYSAIFGAGPSKTTIATSPDLTAAVNESDRPAGAENGDGTGDGDADGRPADAENGDGTGNGDADGRLGRRTRNRIDDGLVTLRSRSNAREDRRRNKSDGRSEGAKRRRRKGHRRTRSRRRDAEASGMADVNKDAAPNVFPNNDSWRGPAEQLPAPCVPALKPAPGATTDGPTMDGPPGNWAANHQPPPDGRFAKASMAGLPNSAAPPPFPGPMFRPGLLPPCPGMPAEWLPGFMPMNMMPVGLRPPVPQPQLQERQSLPPASQSQPGQATVGRPPWGGSGSDAWRS